MNHMPPVFMPGIVGRLEAELSRKAAVRGEVVPPPKKRPTAGRNDPCPCGSGKKFKKCCRVRVEVLPRMGR